MNNSDNHTKYNTSRSRIAAGFLAIFFGGLGIHKFYLGKVKWGLAYLFFSWTYIPAFLSFIEGIIYLCMSDESFISNYP